MSASFGAGLAGAVYSYARLVAPPAGACDAGAAGACFDTHAAASATATTADPDRTIRAIACFIPPSSLVTGNGMSGARRLKADAWRGGNWLGALAAARLGPRA